MCDHRPGEWIEGRLRLLEELGRGAFGVVWRAEEVLDFGPKGEPLPLRSVAVKCLPPLTGTEGEWVYQEARALAELDHPSILRFFYALPTPEATYLVTELATGGNARRFFGGSPPTQEELRELVFAIGSGLAYLHERNLVHGDLKPENVLVTDRDERTVRFLLADFGLRTLIGTANFQGTIPYVPPEGYPALRGRVSDRSDVFALGVLLFELATAQNVADLLPDELNELLRDPQADPKVVRVAHRHLLERVQATDWRAFELSPFVGQMVQMCLAFDPKQRPSAQGFLELWHTFERRRVAVPRPNRQFPKEQRQDLPYARLVGVLPGAGGNSTWIAQLATAGGDWLYVQVTAHDNPGIARLLCQLAKEDLQAEPPMLSFFALVPISWEEHRFRADQKSYAVLEPLELISVTEVCRSELCERPLLNRWLTERPAVPNSALLQGVLAHDLFRRLLEAPSRSFEALWQEIWQEQCLLLAAACEDDRALERLRSKLKEAWDALTALFGHSLFTSRELVRLESNRWSFELGLVGRVDAVFLSSRGQVQLMELKTGRRIQDSDFDQLRAYAALLEESDPQLALNESGSLLRAGLIRLQERLIQPVHQELDRPAFTDARNRAVLLHRRLLQAADPSRLNEDPTYPRFGFDRQRCRLCERYRRYEHQDCRIVSARLGETPTEETPDLTPLSPQEREYFWYWMREILYEERIQRRQRIDPLFESFLGEQPPDPEQAELQILRRIPNAAVTSVLGDQVVFSFPPTTAELNVGDPVVLHRGDLRRWQEIHYGTIEEISETQTTIRLAGSSSGAVFHDEPENWVIERSPGSGPSGTLRRALAVFLNSSNAPMKRLVLEGTIPRRQGRLFALRGEQRRIGNLNRQQRSALIQALDEDGLLLITGPPGTGKTRTIQAIVRAVTDRGGRVLLASFTNNAIDNVLEGLADGSTGRVIPFLRTGHSTPMTESVREQLKANGHDPRWFFAEEIGAVAESVRAVRERLAQVRVYAGTAHSLLHSPWVLSGRDQLFDLVLIDEATQLPEPLAAALLVMGRKGVLVGDEQQLGPVASRLTLSDPAAPPAALAGLEFAGLRRSLFERLNRLLRQNGEEDRRVLLTRQYRMHPRLAEWVSEQFYGGQLETALQGVPGTAALRRAAQQPQWRLLTQILDPERPMVFLDVPDDGQEYPHAHLPEAQVAALLVLALNRLGIQDVGCIAPYRNQLALLRREVTALGGTAECDTIDAFQGREKTVVILSTARRDRMTDFVNDVRRLNVAITRARAKCIVLGSRKLMPESPVLYSFLTHRDCYRDRVEPKQLIDELGIP